MIEIIRGEDRHFSDFGWLKTYWLFSFADYYDPGNLQFGALRVFNDDVVEPRTGFPTHPHREMEIVTVVLDGTMTHRDSMGNEAVIGPGDVQRMSAGTGLTHSEINQGETPVHFFQIWIFPDERGLEPSYDQRHYDPEQWRDTLLPVASGRGVEGAATFHTEATIHRCALSAGRRIAHEATDGRRVFVYLDEGIASLEGHRLTAGDQARCDADGPLELTAERDSHLILIDVPSCRDFGYDRRTLRGERL